MRLGYQDPNWGLRDPYGGTESPFSHRLLMSSLLGPPEAGPSPTIYYTNFDRLDRFTKGREIDEMLADILFICTHGCVTGGLSNNTPD